MGPGFVNVQEVYKSGKVREEDVKTLQVWTESQPHLPKINELDLVLFLHSCHCSNEAAKQCIDTYYSMRTHSPEFFKGQDPRNNPNLFDTMLYHAMPRRTKNGYQILFGHFVDNRANMWNFSQIIKALDMATMLGLYQHGPADGFIVITDITGLTFSHLTKINLLLLKKFFMYLQEALPVRLKGIHHINKVPCVDNLMALIKPFLKNELRNFIFFHDDVNVMQQHVDLECLPSDYGGTGPSRKELKKIAEANVAENVDFFVDLENKTVDESKRPGTPKNAGDFFGAEGTFKKLDID